MLQVTLPNTTLVDEENALGINWHVMEDLFSVRADVVLGGGRTGQEVTEVLVKKYMSLIINPEIKLSLRICLSIHAKAYDPLGLVFPTKMFGALLFRKTLQFVNAKYPPS